MGAAKGFIGIGIAVVAAVFIYFSLSNSLKQVDDADKWLAYEYGVCRFIDGLPISECGGQEGLNAYNKWYSKPGSWVYGENPRLGEGIAAGNFILPFVYASSDGEV